MSKKYDVVIIGAGIGGLVSGCYLSKAGVKTLIVEQHNKPGGYCSSFERQGYRFDVGINYFGGLKNGVMGTLIKELHLEKKIRFNQFDPADEIIMPDNKTYIRTNPFDTIKEFQNSFPNEKKNIENFFRFIMEEDILDIYAKTKKISFQQLLDNFFVNKRVKSTVGILIYNIGASPSYASAFSSIILLRQYILDPGYYPEGGIQQFPDLLAEYFRENNGNLILSKKVVKIIVKNKKVKGVILDDGKKIKANIIVSNADATETFEKLLDVSNKESGMLNKIRISPSMFIIYLGLNIDLKEKVGKKCNLFFFDSYNINRIFIDLENNILKNNPDLLICSFPSLHDETVNPYKSTMTIMVFAPFKTPKFWNKYKNILCDKLLNKVSRLKILPNFRDSINLRIIATPQTLFRYTSNRNGSFAGWIPTVRGSKINYISQETSIQNLYLAGHWSSNGYLHYGGVPNVVSLGRRASQIILRRFKNNKICLK